MKRMLAKIFGTKKQAAPLFFYNTLTKSKQQFELLKGAQEVRMYNCGPTVYDTSHIGNLRSYVFADLIRRTLEWNGFKVKQVINITDFGHLSSDADSGNDKMTKGLRREGLSVTLENMRLLADKYIEQFKRDLRRMNIDTDRIQFPRASDHVAAQIAMIKTLEEKAYTYRGRDGVYFDTSRFPEYGKLGSVDLAGLREGARVQPSDDKRSPTDFFLWKSDAHMGWDSPWGRGFPGWHIECSAMINATLGKQIDIHTGGVDLIPTHHNNEIAQSESATGKRPFSRFWMHNEFLNLNEEKISKSVGNVIDLSTLVEKDYHPLSYRYLLLNAHYRQPSNFTWEALDAAQTSFLKLRRWFDTNKNSGTAPANWISEIRERLNDDLDTPGALAHVWDMLKDKAVAPADAKAAFLDADRVFGLNFAGDDSRAVSLYTKIFGVEIALESVPERIRTLVIARETARKEKNWQHADGLRGELQKMNYTIEDTPEGTRIFRKG